MLAGRDADRRGLDDDDRRDGGAGGADGISDLMAGGGGPADRAGGGVSNGVGDGGGAGGTVDDGADTRDSAGGSSAAGGVNGLLLGCLDVSFFEFLFELFAAFSFWPSVKTIAPVMDDIDFVSLFASSACTPLSPSLCA